MKCELCGNTRISFQTIQDYEHNHLIHKKMIYCPACGYHRSLNDCHDMSDLQRKDITVKELEQKRSAALHNTNKPRSSASYVKPINSTAPTISPSPQPTADSSKQQNSPIGYIIVILSFLILLFSIFGSLMNAFSDSL